jgi:hypothetical protein
MGRRLQSFICWPRPLGSFVLRMGSGHAELVVVEGMSDIRPDVLGQGEDTVYWKSVAVSTTIYRTRT